MQQTRTIQCELFGNPDTAAGPKARAVFIAAPVYGTANLWRADGRASENA
jgi:hypothetical protein